MTALPAMLAEILHAFRLLRRAPAFTATITIVLALGVGANTAIFSVIHAVLLHPFPYTDSDRITFINSTPAGGNGSMPVTYPDYLEMRRQSHAFDQLAYASNRDLNLTQVREPATLKGALVSAPVWPLLGVAPVIGRTFTDAEDRPGAAPVCVISSSLWTGRLGGGPQVLGRELMLDGRAYTVVGVMPPRFKFWAGEVWIPVGLEADTPVMRSRVMRMNTWMVGKLAAGTTLKQGNAELALITKRIADQFPDTNKGVGAEAGLLADTVTGPIRNTLLMLLGAVGFVLLIACANVANLILARANTRHREFAIRAALGAGRGRLVRQILLECVPLALLGSVTGILVGAWGLRGLLALMPADVIPAEAVISVNLPVMLLSLVVCTGTMVLFALFPAFEATRGAIAAGLQEGARGTGGSRSSRVRSSLVLVEVALSLVLLVGAGLLIRSFGRLQAVEPGFNPEHLLVMSIRLPEARYPSPTGATRFFEDVVSRARRLPNVTAVGASSNMPLLGGSGMPLIVEGRTYASMKDLRGVQFSAVTPDYFAAQGLRLTRGRAFTDSDRAGGEPVVILSEEAVKRFLPRGDPLGRRVMIGLPANLNTPGLLPKGLDTFQWSRVVGVVESARYFGLQSQPAPAAYLPIGQVWEVPLFRNAMFVLMRTSGDPLKAAASARSLVSSVDPDQPIQNLTTMDSVLADTLRQDRFSVLLLGVFAAIASVLAAVGIYGIVTWNVTQRTREIGIRTALGATSGDVVRMIVGQSMRVVVLGLVLGLAASLALTQVLETMLYETSPFDAPTIAVVVLGLAAVALLACFLPARRATRVDPSLALRAE